MKYSDNTLHKKKTVWVIDDDISILKVIQIILENENYNVFTIQDTNMLKKMIKENMPDLILLDIWMSGKDGHVITKEFKCDKKTKKIPIVMISALSNVQELAEKSGADGFLKKPFDIKDLLGVVWKYTKNT
ncbi:MAG: hypothetical protein A2857_05920 [Candidatus Levybacteria bacterium RIFCSPHIGHO2_01_FULL_36_15]|nr:MAG: hypothetical protein A2857_05920 [Candidatus Levybacteria bacterium RIFCSPHIGHO2_01_FULL_36_15]OGH38430.1 MAG: hypothetical protein A2905_00720 [Candidatus Levybacteria bacterium RIFCSPLOWO2_01_FULL_36_10]